MTSDPAIDQALRSWSWDPLALFSAWLGEAHRRAETRAARAQAARP